MALSAGQKLVAQSNHRFKVVIAGRRYGKTHLAIRELCKAARYPDRHVWMIAPTYRQVKQIVWRKLKQRLQDLNWVAKINESELTIILKNDSIISLKGADNADSLRGVGLDYIIMDEFADIEPEAWFEVLRPTLADRQGGALFIGTPKGVGNWAHDLYQMPVEFPDSWASWQFTTLDGGRVPLEEIEQAKRDLDERTFRQEFLASFETFAGKIYYSFDRRENVKPQEDINTDIIYVGCDQNVSPMSAVIAVRHGDDLLVIDEIVLYGSNTDELVDEIKHRYPRSKVWIYPDPSGNQRRSSAGGRTDHTILQRIRQSELALLQDWLQSRDALLPKLLEADIKPACGARMAAEQPALHQLYRHIDDMNADWDKEALRQRLMDHRTRSPEDLRQVDCPILLVANEEDVEMPPMAAAAIAAVVPGTEVAHIAKAGHSGYFERPQEFNRIVGEFLEKTR